PSLVPCAIRSSHVADALLSFCMLPQPPSSTLFPYTTLFRSWSGIDLSKLYRQVNSDPDPDSGAEQIFRAGFKEFSRLSQQQGARSEEHTSELQSRENLVCRLLLEKKKHQLASTGSEPLVAGC